MHWSEEETNKAIGKTLESWREGYGEELILSFNDTSEGRFYHSQDCCESVYLYGESYKQLNNFIGKKISRITWKEEYNPNVDECYESATLTTIFIAFEDSEDNPVIIQFFGSSNGYYSEIVDFRISP
jgi:hypothetical protein